MKSKITESLSEGEKYGIISQVRRSALSIPAYIAEGHSKGTRKLILLLDLYIIDKNTYSELNNDIIEIKKALNNLILVLSKDNICH